MNAAPDGANMRRLHQWGESAAALAIRDATAADIPALARFHVTTWNATYAPFLMTGPDPGIGNYGWRDLRGLAAAPG